MSLPDSPTDENFALKTHKRKGDDVFPNNPANHVVLVDGNTCNINTSLDGMARMEALKLELQNRRNKYLVEAKGTDPLLEELKMVGAVDHEPLESMVKKSEEIKADLDQQIEEAKAACQQESSVLAQLTANLQLLEQNRNKLLHEVDEIDQRQIQLQEQIALHQQEAAQEIEIIDSVDEERKRQVPRLKHTISLYASTTGIKWDFSKEDILAGSVVRFLCSLSVLESSCRIS